MSEIEKRELTHIQAIFHQGEELLKLENPLNSSAITALMHNLGIHWDWLKGFLGALMEQKQLLKQYQQVGK